MTNPNQPLPESIRRQATADVILKAGAIGAQVVDFADRSALIQTSVPQAAVESGKYAAIEKGTTENVSAITAAEQHSLRTFIGDDRKKLGEFSRGVEALDPPRFLRNAFGVANTHAMVRKVVMTEENPDGKTNFFQWYRHAVAEKQQTFETGKLPEYLHAFQERLAKAVEDKIAPPEVLDRFTGAVAGNKLHIQFTDIPAFSNSHATTQLFRNSEAVVQVANDVGEDELEHVLTHEFGHVIEGSSGTDAEQDSGLILVEQLGLSRLFGTGVGGKALLEATDELFADSLIHGDIDEMSPLSEAREHSEAYFAERLMHHVVCTAGLKRIDPRLFTRAALADGNVGSNTYFQELTDALEGAYPNMDIIGRIKSLEPEGDEPTERTVLRFAQQLKREMEAVKADAEYPATSETAA